MFLPTGTTTAATTTTSTSKANNATAITNTIKQHEVFYRMLNLPLVLLSVNSFKPTSFFSFVASCTFSGNKSGQVKVH